MKKRILALLILCILCLTACTSGKNLDTNDFEVTTVDDVIDFSDYTTTTEAQSNTPADDKTYIWTASKAETMKTTLSSNYYVNFVQTSTNGVVSSADIYAVLNKYEVWADLDGKDFKITKTTSENSTINSSTFVVKDDGVYYLDPSTSTFVETADTSVTNVFDVNNYNTVQDLFDSLCGIMLPNENTVGTVDEFGYEHYVINSNSVNESLLAENFKDYTKLKNQSIEFVYDNTEHKPVQLSITINYQKDDTECYAKTVIDFISIAFNSTISVN